MIFWLCVFPFVFSPWKRRKPFRLTKARYPPKRLACGRGWWMRRVVWRRALWSFKALIGTCDAGLKPPPNGGTGPNLIRPGTCFSDFRYRFKSVLRNSGRICLASRSQGNVRFASSSTTERARLPHFNKATCGFRSPALAGRLDFREIEFRGKTRRRAVLRIRNALLNIIIAIIPQIEF